MEENKTFIIKVPELPQQPPNKQKNGKQKNSNIDEFKKSIKSQYDELISFQDIGINNENKENLEKLILATEDLISNCMNDNIYSGNRDQYFVNLIFICHKLSLKIETFKIEEKLKALDNKSNAINKNQLRLEKKQEKSEEQSNNLVYNILGFIASFSVVSASISAIDKMNNLSDVMLFMAFTAFILLTTLIALNNFYKSTNTNKKISLQNNKFIWVMLVFVIILLLGYKGIQWISSNKNEIFESIGRGIGQVIESKDVIEAPKD